LTIYLSKFLDNLGTVPDGKDRKELWSPHSTLLLGLGREGLSNQAELAKPMGRKAVKFLGHSQCPRAQGGLQAPIYFGLFI
jgi:hypothetical protein